jgi:glycosyltransferase involved in cell wall biosynthesis
MTVFNREKYISEAVKSIIQSTYQNWELIIVDDQSKDESYTIAIELQKLDNRIKVYRNEHNLGDYPNRNKAASLASGKYLKYVDADDKVYPHGLEQLVYYMEQHPNAGYGLCSLGQDNDNIYPQELTTEQAYLRHYFSSKTIFHKTPLSSIISKKAFDTIGGFTGKRMVGDFELWHLLSQKYSVVLMPQGIVWYRIHDDGEMQFARDNSEQLFEYYLIEEQLLKNKQCPLSDTKTKEAIKECYRKQCRFMVSNLKSHGLKTFKKLKSKTSFRTPEIFTRAFS